MNYVTLPNRGGREGCVCVRWFDLVTKVRKIPEKVKEVKQVMRVEVGGRK